MHTLFNERYVHNGVPHEMRWTQESVCTKMVRGCTLLTRGASELDWCFMTLLRVQSKCKCKFRVRGVHAFNHRRGDEKIRARTTGWEASMK